MPSSATTTPSRATSSSGPSPRWTVSHQRYKLAAIIDWEMAGFFPFAYERGLKDVILRSSHLSYS